MKKLLKSPNNLVRRVLSKTSNLSASNERKSKSTKQDLMSEEQQQLADEIESLKKQIKNLKVAINNLKENSEKKEIAIGRLATEKEHISMELLKQKRSNSSLLKQLEQERKFYYQEKEHYCKEMNQFERMKQVLSNTNMLKDGELAIEHYKKEITKIKQTLNQTLEANYNLSIKFLRMKNTKTCLKTELKTIKLEHEKLINDYKKRIHNLAEELNDLIQERLNTPISCSSKKYLHLVKQNSCLVYENLCLQLEVDNLHIKCEKLKLDKTKSETNSRLKYIRHDTPKPKEIKKEHKRVRIKDERPEKLEKDLNAVPSTSKQAVEEPILKIFERHKLPDVPDIKLSKEFDPNKEKQPQLIPSVQENGAKEKNALLQNVLNNHSSKLALFQVSNISSRTSTVTNGSLVRVRSSPEIARPNSYGNC